MRLGNILTFILEARLYNIVYTSLENRGSLRAYSDLLEVELYDIVRTT